MASQERLKKRLQNALKLGGFNIRREFVSLLLEKFNESGVDLSSTNVFDETVKNISSILETQCLSGHSIEREHIDRALEVCLRSGYDHNETVFSVINAFDFPRLSYNLDRKIYLLDTKKSKLLSDADAKSRMFLERYSQAKQRVKRTFALTLNNVNLKLQTVDYLLTLSKVELDKTMILGSLLMMGDGSYVLEDPTGTVKLDLSRVIYHPGLFVENSIVLINGDYEDKTLVVTEMAMPTGEEYIISRPTFGNINYFGGPSTMPLKDSKRLKNHIRENPDGMFVFLSDLWLDHPQTFQKLEKLFEQMEQFAPPIAFVFMGNFMYESHGIEMLNDLKKLFKRLGELISKYHILVTKSQFVFVPGLTDPCTPHMAPRLELPDFVADEMRKVVPSAIFATNPCRIQYCNKEIVVFRADILSKLIQGSLHKPSKEDILKSITKTIIGQAHLTPLSLNALNVHWDYDHCLSLYPLPDLVVIGDKFEAYKDHYKDCILMNPGQFCTGEFGFKMYYPGYGIDDAIADCAVDVADSEMS